MEKNKPIKFVHKDDMGELGQKWRKDATINEQNHKNGSSTMPYQYRAWRKEDEPGASEIEILHEESFINDVIPKLIERKKERNQKVKILDNGGGVGLLADQIRQTFGNQVEVYSTGLSKQAARDYRKLKKLPKLHPDDLKWRSIQELSNFPEFDLIIDTYGEQYYRSGQRENAMYVDPSYGNGNSQEWFRHISQVIKKLLPGGYATLAPVSFATKKDRVLALEKIKNQYGVKAYFVDTEKHPNNHQFNMCLKIEKPLN